VAEQALDVVGSALGDEGHDVHTQRTDVSDAASVEALAERAAALGRVRSVVNTAGLSPVQSSANRVVAVDLVGMALVLDAFGAVIAPGGAGVVISSMAGHLAGSLSVDDEAALAQTAASDLLSLPCVERAASDDAGMAYAFAKAGASVRVRAAATPWGRRGARINAISPGVIATAMGEAELEGPSGEFMRLMVESSGAGRLGTPDDIASVTEFLLSHRASFVTGVDLLVDGGVVAAVRNGQIASPG
jgi:NAD(P)-dependent dehydrogenase (short-subunit alcohol dehydrogenase family)